MISEQMEIDCNAQSETIITHISDHLLQGFNISLVLSKPKDEIIQYCQQEQKVMHGPNLTPQQIQHKEVLDEVPFADERSLKSILLDKKFEQAMIYFQKENYQKCALQLESIKMQLNFHLKSGKMNFTRRKHTLILAIQIHYYASQCWKQLGDLPKAIDRLEECLKHYVINEQEVLSKLTLELGLLYMCQQRYNKAFEIFKKLLILYEQLNWKADQGYVLSHIAFLYCLYGLPDEAKRIGTEALDICRSVLPATHNVTRQVYFYLGYIYFINKELEYAQEFLELALPKQVDDKSQLHINVLNLLAMVSHMRGLEIQSVRMYQRALEITSEKNRSKLLNNLGLVFMDQGRMGKAKQMFTRAHELIKDQLHMATSKAKRNINFLLTHIL